MSSVNERFDAEVESLLADAAWWRLAGLLFERPRGDWWREVASLALDVDDDELRDAARLAQQAGEGAYLAALGPSGVVSPRQAGHDGHRDPGQVLAGLMACYDAFAYHPRAEEPADHVAVEAGCVGYLRLKQAFARASGQMDQASIVSDAVDWMIEHLRTYAHALAGALAAAELEHLRLAATALARRVGQPPAAAPPRIIWMAEDSPTCGDTM